MGVCSSKKKSNAVCASPPSNKVVIDKIPNTNDVNVPSPSSDHPYMLSRIPGIPSSILVRHSILAKHSIQSLDSISPSISPSILQSKKLIIICDDDVINLRIMKKFIRNINNQNYWYKYFTSGENAIKFIIMNDKFYLHAIITDYSMYKYSGYDVILMVKKLYPDIITVGMSATADNLELFKQINTHYVFAKPIIQININMVISDNYNSN